MNSLIALCGLLVCSTYSAKYLSIKPNENPLGTISDVKNFFQSNLGKLSYEFKKTFDQNWNPTVVKNVANILNLANEDECGYLVSFDKGYVAYSLNLSIYDYNTFELLENKNEYYLLNNEIFYEENSKLVRIKEDAKISTNSIDGTSLINSFFKVSEVVNLNNFSLTSCLCPIPFLMKNYTNIEFGDWTPLCINQGKVDCTPTAFSNLIFMYKEKGIDDLTLGLTPEEVRTYFGQLANIGEEGTLDSNIHPAMKKYLEVAGAYNNEQNKWQALAGTKDGYPSLASYQRDGSGHSAVRIGTGQVITGGFSKVIGELSYHGEPIMNLTLLHVRAYGPELTAIKMHAFTSSMHNTKKAFGQFNDENE